jgi:uncharacterized protein with PIN domain
MERSDIPRFGCDAMLGGVARWLRAAGYESWWEPDIEDRELVRRCQGEGLFLLSCDHRIFYYRLLRDGIVPGLYISHPLPLAEQFSYVMRELRLPLREPRCMRCGGELVERPKDEVRERIPPRTLAWLDRYWECRGCGQLFWHGTHWNRIEQRLRQIAESPREIER